MKRDRNQHIGEGKGKRKKNDHGNDVGVVGQLGTGKEGAGGGGKGGTEKSGKDIETFNPQLSARELKKIQYYENMFKKMERKREERQNEGDSKGDNKVDSKADNKGKKKDNNQRSMKRETEPSTKEKGKESSGEALEESGKVAGEAVVTKEKEDHAKQSCVTGTAQGNSQKGGKNAEDTKEAKHKPKKANPKMEPRETCANAVSWEKQDEPQSMDDNERGKNNKWRNVEKSQIRIKKEELSMGKGTCSKVTEGSNKAVTLKGKKCLDNSNRLVRDIEGGGDDDELHSTERNFPRGESYNRQSSASPKHYTYKKNGMAEAGKGDKVKEENRKSSVSRHKMDGDKEHESDHDVNYDNAPNEMINFKGKRKIYSERERGKRVLKIKRSFSVSSNINEYFFDTSSIQLMNYNDHDPSAYGKEEHSSGEDNDNEPTFNYKKKKLLQVLTHTDDKDSDTVNSLVVGNNGSSSNNSERGNYNLSDSEKWLIWKNKKNYNILFASNNNSRKRNKWHIVRSYDELRVGTNKHVDLHPHGKENVVYEQMNMNGRSNGTEYFINRDTLPLQKKSFCEKKIHAKTVQGSNTTNMIMHANKNFDVTCCIRKYLDNMRYTNLKKLKNVNRGNLKLYVNGCTNFLNFDKVDSAILSMRKFQEALQRRGGVGGRGEGDAAPL
ncbi:hypothetical protein AK88_02737 [Plasmodium fragile]|uniref:Uncharacterized protein n=1 Tax=Plasmodium fragile TaxID=5857 RepID=A0A0D9QKN3_PLAFR|nr:uncharacterized protein AK88_02737 [Plasmodium fragile]KJP87569.1 hypothetical protein AK88_02737 [Plasmodium fragile]